MEKSQCPKCNALEFVKVEGEYDGQPVSYFVCESWEFAQVFAQSVSKEYSINPDLHTIVMVAFLPAGTEVIENLLKENSCEDYFIEKINKENKKD